MAKQKVTTTKKTSKTQKKIIVGGNGETGSGVKVCPYCGQAMR